MDNEDSHPTGRWSSTTIFLATWWFIGILSEVVTVLLLQTGTKEEITRFYGLANGTTALLMLLVIYSFVARQRADHRKWNVGSLVFVLCLVISIVLSAETMQDAFVYSSFYKHTSIFNLLSTIIGLLALLFLGKRKSGEQYGEYDPATRQF